MNPENDQCLELVDHQSPAGKLQDEMRSSSSCVHIDQIIVSSCSGCSLRAHAYPRLVCDVIRTDL